MYTDALGSEVLPTVEALNGDSVASVVHGGLNGVGIWLVDLRDLGLRGMFIMLTGCWYSVIDPKLDLRLAVDRSTCDDSKRSDDEKRNIK